MQSRWSQQQMRFLLYQATSFALHIQLLHHSYPLLLLRMLSNCYHGPYLRRARRRRPKYHLPRKMRLLFTRSSLQEEVL